MISKFRLAINSLFFVLLYFIKYLIITFLKISSVLFFTLSKMVSFIIIYINQMASESITTLTLQNYIYEPQKPYYTKGSYQIFNGTQK